MSYLSFSKRWAGYLKAKTGISAEKEAVLTYVIEVLVINVVNIFFTLLLGFLLGVFPGTLACLVTVAVFRHTAGGAHSASPWRCALITILVFPTLAMAASLLTHLNQLQTDILSTVVLLVGLISILMLAPVDTPAAPIISPVRRKRLKAFSLLAMVLVTCTIIMLRFSTWVHSEEISLCLVLSVIWVSFILSASGHRIMILVDAAKVPLQRR